MRGFQNHFSDKDIALTKTLELEISTLRRGKSAVKLGKTNFYVEVLINKTRGAHKGKFTFFFIIFRHIKVRL